MKRYVRSATEDVGYALVLNLKELLQDWTRYYRDDRPKGDLGRYNDYVKYMTDRMYDYLHSTSRVEVEKAVQMYAENNFNFKK